MAKNRKHKKNKVNNFESNNSKKIKQRKNCLSKVELDNLCNQIVFSKQKIKIISNF